MHAPHLTLVASGGWVVMDSPTLPDLRHVFAVNADARALDILDAAADRTRFKLGINRYYRCHEPLDGILPRRSWTFESDGKINVSFLEKPPPDVVVRSMNAGLCLVERLVREFHISLGGIMTQRRWQQERLGCAR